MNTSRAYKKTWQRWAVAVAFMLVAFLMLAGTKVSAQQPRVDENAAGNTFIIAYPDTTTNTYDTRFVHQRFADGIKLMIYSSVDTKVAISRTNGVTKNFQLQAGKFKILEMTGPDGFPQPIVTIRNEVVDNTLKIECKDPIVVYCYMLTGFGCEAWTPIPMESWGMQYYAAAHPGEVGADITPGGENNFNRKNKAFPSEILIMAAFDKTQVSIQPNGTLVDYPPISVTLNAGQAYLVQCTVDTLLAHVGNPDYQSDLGGTIITATRPIGVISGNTRSQLYAELAGLGGNSFKNMLIEWIAPNDQHGKEFVYMPSWDARKPTGAPKEDLQGKRLSEYVRIYSTDPDSVPGSPTLGTVTDGVSGSLTNFTTNTHPPGLAGWLYDDRISVFLAKRYRTQGAAQGFMASPGISKNEGVSGGGNFIGATYRAWGGYMTEMVPREQWVKFAPYYAPTDPAGMEHFINVVTDSANRFNVYKEDGSFFIFNRGLIPGTDLYWGTMTVTPGIDHFLEGRKGAKFYAFAYGQFQGDDLYRPGKTRKKDDGSGIAARGKGNPSILHPSEYEERLGLGYAYPLAPTRLVLRPPDSLEILTEMDCACMTVKIRALNQNPVGLKVITLDPDTSQTQNAYIRFYDPINTTQEIRPTEVLGASRALVKVCAINELRDAKATVVIKDRTGKIWRIPYKYEAERAIINPDTSLDFGVVTLNSSKDLTVTITNPLQKNLEIQNADLYFKGTNGFTIVSSTPALPTILGSGQSVVITIRLSPTQNKSYYDTLQLKFGCAKARLPLKGEPVLPCVYVDDLAFGTLLVNESRTMDLKICNKSSAGSLQFVAPYLDYDNTNFTVDPAYLDTLKNANLGPKECVTIKVRFSSPVTGLFRIVAHFHTTVNCERDTSVWTATVVEPGPQITGYDWKNRWVTPKATNNCTKNTVTEYRSVVYVSNSGSTPYKVQSINLVGPDAAAGYFKFDSSNITELINVGDQIKVGDTGTLARPQGVLFMPKDQRSYSCIVQMITDGNDTVQNFLLGSGEETDVRIGGKDFGTLEFTGYPATQKFDQVYVTVPQTANRALNVTGLRIIGPDFQFDPAFVPSMPTPGNPWVIQPGGTSPAIGLVFQPLTPGAKQARIEVLGDHPFCSDSGNTLLGNTYTQGAQVTDKVFNDILPCFDEMGTISITNTGTNPIFVNSLTMKDPNGIFTLMNVPSLPLQVQPGETKTIDVHYAPAVPGSFTATVEWDVKKSDGTTDLGILVSNLSGKAHFLTASTHMDRNYKRFPGAMITTPVYFDGAALDEARIDKFYFEIKFNHGVVLMKNYDQQTLTQGTMTQGWTTTVSKSSDTLVGIDFSAPPGSYLTGGAGTLMNLNFLTFLGDTTCSELDYHITLDPSKRSCALINVNPGRACIDSVCGMNFRLITLTSNKYALDQNKPNPATGSTDITFSLGLDGNTSLTVYNARGEKVATLVSGYLKPGTYSVTWDAKDQASGLYYYRLNSGTWSKTNSLILQK